jgi:outer membrane protein, heavy metal efflux system
VKAAVFMLMIAACSTTAAAQQAAGRQPLTLAELEQLALQNNPTAMAAQAAVDATRSLASQAGAWPNPVFGYSGSELGEQRGQHGFFVDQTILLGGKLRLSRAVFDKTTDRAQANVDLQKQRILGSVRSLFYRTLAAERQVEVHERLSALVSEAVGVTSQLFNVGAADKPDHLEIEIESLRVQLALDGARNELFAMRQRLAAAVGSADVADRPLAGSIEAAIPDLERDTLIRTLIETSPQVRAARAELERARAITALARRQTYPNLFLRGGASYNRELNERTAQAFGWQGEVEAGVSLPLFNRNRGGITAAEADERRAQSDLQRVELSLRAEAASQFATYLTALREEEVYRTQILSRAEEAYRLFLGRYRQMAAAYPQVLVAQQTLFTMTREYLGSIDRVWRSATALQGMLAGDALTPPSVDGVDTVTLRRDEGAQ